MNSLSNHLAHRTHTAAVILISFLSFVFPVGFAYCDPLPLEDSDFSEQRVTSWISKLSDRDIEVRSNAIAKLGEFGPEAQRAVPELIALLQHRSIRNQRLNTQFENDSDVVSCLFKIGLVGIDCLRQHFEELPLEVKRHIITGTLHAGPDARVFIPQFKKAFERSDDSGFRKLIANAVCQLDHSGREAIPFALNILKNDSSETVRSEVARLFSYSDFGDSMGEVWARNSPQLIALIANGLSDALNDVSADVRATAAESLSAYPQAGKRAIASLLKLLDDDKTLTKQQSADTGVLLTVAECAAFALASFPDQEDAILPVLVKFILAFNDGSKLIPPERFAELAARSKPPYKELELLLESRDFSLAMTALAKSRDITQHFIEKLDRLSKSGDHDLAHWAQTVLTIHNPEKYPRSELSTQRFLASGRPTAFSLLKVAGSRGSFAIPSLSKLTRDADGYFDWAVIETLVSIEAPDDLVLPVIIESLDSPFYFDATSRRKIFANVGIRAIPQLIKKLKTPQTGSDLLIECLLILSSFGS
jgi:hypothetical protein